MTQQRKHNVQDSPRNIKVPLPSRSQAIVSQNVMILDGYGSQWRLSERRWRDGYLSMLKYVFWKAS
eukprot:8093572-Pyramimonas_sp.AAC.1